MGMEVLGIGPLEFLFIFIIILLVLGPKDIEKTARNLGKNLNRLYRSPSYQVIRKASEEIRNLPTRLAAEAQLEELKEMADFKDIEKDLNAAVKDINTAAADPMKAWVEEQKAADLEALAPAGGKPTAPASTSASLTRPNRPFSTFTASRQERTVVASCSASGRTAVCERTQRSHDSHFSVRRASPK